MGGGDSNPAPYTPQPQAPDPTKTAEAQFKYNTLGAVATKNINDVDQVTPYGDITYTQDGGEWVGAEPAKAATPATGGYWNGYAWVPTGGSPAVEAKPGVWTPHYKATTKLTPLLQSLVDQSIYNARGVGGLETDLIGQLKGRAPLDLSWGAKQSNIWGLERKSLDPYWKQQQEFTDQRLADQGLTPGSQGYGYQQKQFNQNRADAYDKAMLAAQSQASADIQAEYNEPYNVLSSLRSNAQIQQPGVGQTAATTNAPVAAAPYAQVAQSDYATQAQLYANAQDNATKRAIADQQQQSDLMGGLFGLGGKLLGGLGIFGSDRRDKTDIKRLGVEPETNLPMYSYRYKGDPKTYPKVVGPMAQDVEKQYPEHAGEIAGHKVIFGLGG